MSHVFIFLFTFGFLLGSQNTHAADLPSLFREELARKSISEKVAGSLRLMLDPYHVVFVGISDEPNRRLGTSWKMRKASGKSRPVTSVLFTQSFLEAMRKTRLIYLKPWRRNILLEDGDPLS